MQSKILLLFCQRIISLIIPVNKSKIWGTGEFFRDRFIHLGVILQISRFSRSERQAYDRKAYTHTKVVPVWDPPVFRAGTLELNGVKMKEEKMREEQTKEQLELLMKVMAKAIIKPWCRGKKRNSIEQSWKLEEIFRIQHILLYIHILLKVSHSRG